MIRSFQVFRNDSNIRDISKAEGLPNALTFIGVADCATPSGPVDARKIVGLEKNFSSTRDFKAACDAAGYLAKESEGTSDDVSDDQAASFPKVQKAAPAKAAPAGANG